MCALDSEPQSDPSSKQEAVHSLNLTSIDEKSDKGAQMRSFCYLRVGDMHMWLNIIFIVNVVIFLFLSLWHFFFASLCLYTFFLSFLF